MSDKTIEYFRRNVIPEIKNKFARQMSFKFSGQLQNERIMVYSNNYNQEIVIASPYRVSLGEHGIYVNGALRFSN